MHKLSVKYIRQKALAKRQNADNYLIGLTLCVASGSVFFLYYLFKIGDIAFLNQADYIFYIHSITVGLILLLASSAFTYKGAKSNYLDLVKVSGVFNVLLSGIVVLSGVLFFTELSQKTVDKSQVYFLAVIGFYLVQLLAALPWSVKVGYLAFQYKVHSKSITSSLAFLILCAYNTLLWIIFLMKFSG